MRLDVFFESPLNESCRKLCLKRRCALHRQIDLNPNHGYSKLGSNEKVSPKV